MSDKNMIAEKERKSRITFAVGGNVQAKKGFYVSRRTDSELLETCLDGNYSYVLAPRQLGKTSLVIRTAQKLEEKGVLSAIIDLSPIGKKTADEHEWYLSLLGDIIDQLDLDVDLNGWWKQHINRGSSKSLILFFREVLLKQIKERVVIFFDEIDSTINLPFKDDFFASLRYMYNARGLEPEYERLTFVLIGVATPNDLIRDPYRTPFNVGHRVDLVDFSLEEAMPLVEGFGLPLAEARQILGWVFKWTHGHPYLTMRVCRLIADSGRGEWSEDDIDALVAEAFFGKIDQDLNLQFVRDMLTIRIPPDVEQTDVLTTYREIRDSRRRIPDDPRSLVKSHLKLSGVVREEGNSLRLRNPIYQRVFDDQWVKEHLPATWAKQQYQRLRRVAVVLIIALIALGGLAAYALSQRKIAEDQKKIAEDQTRIAEGARKAAEASAVELKKAFLVVEEQRQEVERQRDRAEVALKGQERATELADQRRQEAESQRRLAVEAASRAKQAAEQASELRKVAELERQRSDEAAVAAIKAREEADAQRAIAEQNLALAKSRELTDKHYRDAVDLYLQGNQQAAREKFMLALDQYRKQQPRDVQGEAITLRNIAASYSTDYESANRDEALKKYKEALEVYKQLPSPAGPTGEATTRLDIGILYRVQGRTDDAIAEFNQAKDLFNRTGDKFGVARAVQNIGKVYFNPDGSRSMPDQQQRQVARGHFLDAKKIYQESDNLPGLAETLNDIISTYSTSRYSNEVIDEALPYHDELLEVYKRSGNRSALIDRLDTLVRAYLKKGDMAKGSKYAKQLLSLYKESSDSTSDAYDRYAVTLYPLLPEDYRIEVLNLYGQRLQKYRETGDFAKEARARWIIGSLNYSVHNIREAIQSYEQASQVYQQHAMKKELSNALITLGHLYYEEGDNQKAIESYEKALQHASEAELNQTTTTNLNRILGELHLKLGNKRKALGYFETLLHFFEANGPREGFAGSRELNLIVTTIGMLYKSLNGDKKADEFYANVILGFKPEDRTNLLFSLLYEYVYTGDKAKAVKLAEKILASTASKKEKAPWLNALADFYLLMGDRQKAREFLDKACEDILRPGADSDSVELRRYYFEDSLRIYRLLGEDVKAADLYLRSPWAKFGADQLAEEEEVNVP